jgi:DNA polymerase III epsilon subunit-like protein
MYLIFDTETNGLPDKRFPKDSIDYWPRAVQIAWALYDNAGWHVEDGSYLIKPLDFNISPDAEKIHGISKERAMLVGDKIEKVLGIFSKKLERSSVIIGHNINFDLNVLKFEAARLNRNLDFPEKCYCTMTNDKIICLCKLPSKNGIGYKWPKLTELHQHLFKCDFEGAHNALHDVHACAKCYFELRKRGIIDA